MVAAHVTNWNGILPIGAVLARACGGTHRTKVIGARRNYGVAAAVVEVRDCSRKASESSALNWIRFGADGSASST